VLLAGLAAATFCAFCGTVSAQSPPGKTFNVTVAVVNPINSPDYLILIGQQKGFFKSNGINVKVVAVGNTVAALLSGDVQVSNIGVQGMIPMAQGQQLVFLGSVFPVATTVLLVRPGSPLAEHAHQWPQVMQDLKGKKLGVTVAGAVVDNMARYMAKLAGLDPDKDISITAAGNATTLAANLENGVYDAALQLSPFWETELARKKAVSVLDMFKGEGPKELRTMPFTTPAAMRPFLTANPGFAEAFYKALGESMAWAKDPANRAELTAMVAKENGIEAAELADQITTFLNSLSVPSYSRAEWDAGVAMLKANGIDVSRLDYTKDVVEVARTE
jgi:ABC-type nitrate/sulfonate/bicarbonate transport system substrate-binding protein